MSLRGAGRNAFGGVCTTQRTLSEGMQINVTEGEWEEGKYGWQLAIAKFTVCEDISPAETSKNLLSYLSAGAVKRIGPGLAKLIVDHFGAETEKILNEFPERLADVKGITASTASVIAASWKEGRSTVNAKMPLTGAGLTKAYANRVHKHFGDDAAAIIKDNPYRLTEVHGIGFLKADDIARNFGYHIEHPFRLESGILYILDQGTSMGHCYLTVSEIVDASKDILKLENLGLITDAIKKTVTSGKTIQEDNRIYIPRIYQAERNVSNKIMELAYSVKDTSIDSNMIATLVPHLSNEQSDAVRMALVNWLCVLTGLPGTGKTTTVKGIINILSHTEQSYLLCAPTGKAARRISETTDEEAVTIHRALEYSPWGFRRNAENPLAYDYVIVDEFSMVDIVLFDALLQAIGRHTSLIIVGDSQQLPSIGPGNVLKDMLAARVCANTTLRNIHRQAEGSDIIKIAHVINGGQMPMLRGGMRDVFFIKKETPDEIRRGIKETIIKLGVPFADVQVLSPMRKGPIGTIELNALLQATVQSKEFIGKAYCGFCVGDRVIHTVNDYTKGVFNGETGNIVEIDRGTGIVRVDYGDREIVYKDTEIKDIELAYAITVHRAQGSQFPVVLVVVSTRHYIMLTRQLLYTAITRPQKQLVIVGTEKAIFLAIKNNKEADRNTTLFRAAA